MSNAEAFDRADPNNLSDAFREIALGKFLQGQVMQVRRNLDPVASGPNPENIAADDAISLPLGGKASRVIRAYARAGGVTGEMAIAAPAAAPAAGQVGVGANGDLVFLAADAITDVDVIYVPERGDVLEVVFPVVLATGILVLPAPLVARGVVVLMKAEALEATLTGRKIIREPGVAPAAGEAALDTAKATVNFAEGADGVTRAKVSLLLVAANGLAEFLESPETSI